MRLEKLCWRMIFRLLKTKGAHWTPSDAPSTHGRGVITIKAFHENKQESLAMNSEKTDLKISDLSIEEMDDDIASSNITDIFITYFGLKNGVDLDLSEHSVPHDKPLSFESFAGGARL